MQLVPAADPFGLEKVVAAHLLKLVVLFSLTHPCVFVLLLFSP